MKPIVALLLCMLCLYEVAFCMEKPPSVKQSPRKEWVPVLNHKKEELPEESSPQNIRHAQHKDEEFIPPTTRRAASDPSFEQYKDYFATKKKNKGKEIVTAEYQILLNIQFAFNNEDIHYRDALLASFIEQNNISVLLNLLDKYKDTFNNSFGIFLCEKLNQYIQGIQEEKDNNKLKYLNKLKELKQFFQAQSPLKRTRSSSTKSLSPIPEEDQDEFVFVEEDSSPKDSSLKYLDLIKYIKTPEIMAYILINNHIIVATRTKGSTSITLHSLNPENNINLCTIKDKHILIPACFIEQRIEYNEGSINIVPIDTKLINQPLSLISVQNPLIKVIIVGGKYIIFAEPCRTLFAYNIETKKSIEFEDTECETCDYLFALDDTSFITGSGHKIFLWDIQKNERIELELNKDKSTLICAVLFNKLPLVLQQHASKLKQESAIIFCDFLKKINHTLYQENEDFITALHASERYLFAGMSNGSIKMWDSKKQRGFNNSRELMTASGKSITSLHCYEDTLLVVSNSAIAAYRKLKKNSHDQ